MNDGGRQGKMQARGGVMRWATFAALLLVGGLAVTGVLSGRQAIAVGAAFEVLLLGITGVVVVRAVRRRRGPGTLELQAALATVLPRPIARIISLEPLVFVCLWRWIRGRRPTGPDAFPYARRSPLGALTIVVLLTAPVEILMIELLLPWDWLRWLLLLGSLYATVWLAGLYASLQVLPHQAVEAGLLVRYGLFNRALVPWDALARITPQRGTPPKAGDGLQVDAAGNRAWLAVGGRTDLLLELGEPLAIERLRGATPPVLALHIAADDPDALARAVMDRLEATAGNAAALARR
jgi:hypothetical protein